MIPVHDFQATLTDLANCLPARTGSEIEATRRQRVYYQHLGGLDSDLFVEACHRILYSDEWFPTIARIKTVVSECAADRARSRQAHAGVEPVPELVCPYCHGARWVRLGGADPLNMHAGEDGSRCQPCPRCTSGRRHDRQVENATIRDEGGVPNPETAREVDMRFVTWPQRMAALRDPATGRIDMEALYRLSRELRGLDPNVDERPQPVPGFQTIGRQAPVPMPERETVMA